MVKARREETAAALEGVEEEEVPVSVPVSVPVAEFSVPVAVAEFTVPVEVFSMPVPVPVPTKEELTTVADVEVVTGKLLVLEKIW